MIPISDNVEHERFPIVTVALIAINTAIWVWQDSLANAEMWQLFIDRAYAPGLWGTASVPELFARSIVSMFLHGSWLHLIANMWFLWLFGDNVEDVLGRTRFVVLYLVAGLAAGGAHTLANLDSTIPVVGASGAIGGVIGAYVVLFPWAKITMLWTSRFRGIRTFELSAVVFAGLWFGMQVLGGFADMAGGASGVAWWAHVGGFVLGVAWAKFRRTGTTET